MFPWVISYCISVVSFFYHVKRITYNWSKRKYIVNSLVTFGWWVWWCGYHDTLSYLLFYNQIWNENGQQWKQPHLNSDYNKNRKWVEFRLIVSVITKVLFCFSLFPHSLDWMGCAVSGLFFLGIIIYILWIVYLS